MEENVKSAPEPQGGASAKDKAAPKTGSVKTTKSAEQKAADKAAKAAEKQPNSEHAVTDKKVEKDTPDPGYGPGPDVSAKTGDLNAPFPVKTEVSDEITVTHPENVTVETIKSDTPDYVKEADKILKAVAKGTKELKVSHKAAVIAINSPGVKFDQEEKVLSYEGGKTKLVIE